MFYKLILFFLTIQPVAFEANIRTLKEILWLPYAIFLKVFLRWMCWEGVMAPQESVSISGPFLRGQFFQTAIWICKSPVLPPFHPLLANWVTPSPAHHPLPTGRGRPEITPPPPFLCTSHRPHTICFYYGLLTERQIHGLGASCCISWAIPTERLGENRQKQLCLLRCIVDVD